MDYRGRKVNAIRIAGNRDPARKEEVSFLNDTSITGNENRRHAALPDKAFRKRARDVLHAAGLGNPGVFPGDKPYRIDCAAHDFNRAPAPSDKRSGRKTSAPLKYSGTGFLFP